MTTTELIALLQKVENDNAVKDRKISVSFAIPNAMADSFIFVPAPKIEVSGNNFSTDTLTGEVCLRLVPKSKLQE